MNPNSLPAGFSKEFFLGLKAAEAGGKKILEVYNTKFFFEIKEDGGPVTSADILSQKAIKEILIIPDIAHFLKNVRPVSQKLGARRCG